MTTNLKFSPDYCSPPGATLKEWTGDKNSRRCRLIDKEIEGTLLPAEERELDELQRQMLAHRTKMAPLPIEEARGLYNALLLKSHREGLEVV